MLLQLTRSLVLVATLALPVACLGACAGNDELAATEEAMDSSTVQGDVHTDPPVGTWKLVADTGDVTFDVAADGSITGTAPCNGYFGKWTLGPEQSTLGPFGATRKMCAPDVMDREQAFFAALEKTAGWRATDAGIVLVDKKQAALLHFASAD